MIVVMSLNLWRLKSTSTGSLQKESFKFQDMARMGICSGNNDKVKWIQKLRLAIIVVVWSRHAKLQFFNWIIGNYN